MARAFGPLDKVNDDALLKYTPQAGHFDASDTYYHTAYFVQNCEIIPASGSGLPAVEDYFETSPGEEGDSYDEEQPPPDSDSDSDYNSEVGLPSPPEE